MTKRAFVLGFLAALATLAVACGADADGDDGSGATTTPAGGGAGKTVDVTAQDFSLSPATIDAQPGEEIAISFTNAGSTEHSFTIDNGVIDIEAEGGGSSNGTFIAPSENAEFYCKYHPSAMRGTISVNGDSTSSSGGGGAGY